MRPIYRPAESIPDDVVVAAEEHVQPPACMAGTGLRDECACDLDIGGERNTPFLVGVNDRASGRVIDIELEVGAIEGAMGVDLLARQILVERLVDRDLMLVANGAEAQNGVEIFLVREVAVLDGEVYVRPRGAVRAAHVILANGEPVG